MTCSARPTPNQGRAACGRRAWPQTPKPPIPQTPRFQLRRPRPPCPFPHTVLRAPPLHLIPAGRAGPARWQAARRLRAQLRSAATARARALPAGRPPPLVQRVAGARASGRPPAGRRPPAMPHCWAAWQGRSPSLTRAPELMRTPMLACARAAGPARRPAATAPRAARRAPQVAHARPRAPAPWDAGHRWTADTSAAARVAAREESWFGPRLTSCMVCRSIGVTRPCCTDHCNTSLRCTNREPQCWPGSSSAQGLEC